MSLEGKLSAATLIVNDWMIEVEDIEGGHRLTARRGTELKSMDVMDGGVGKSAYQYAVDGGYAGSEAEFARLQTATKENSERAEQALADLLRIVGSGVATLVDGKVPISQIPAAATQEIYEVSNEGELTALAAQRGDLAELIEEIDGVRTVTRTWQLLGEDVSVVTNWVVWGTSYAVRAGSAGCAGEAENASAINGHRIVQISASEWETAVKDPDTYYLIFDEEAGA